MGEEIVCRVVEDNSALLLLCFLFSCFVLYCIVLFCVGK